MTFHDIEFKFLYVVVDGKKKNPGHIYNEKTRQTLCGHPFGVMLGAKIYVNRDESMALCNACQEAYKTISGTKWTEWEKASEEHTDTIPKKARKAKE